VFLKFGIVVKTLQRLSEWLLDRAVSISQAVGPEIAEVWTDLCFPHWFPVSVGFLPQAYLLPLVYLSVL
jgi:hypothetical protein